MTLLAQKVTASLTRWFDVDRSPAWRTDLANKERLRDGQGPDIKISLEEFLFSLDQELAPSNG